MVITETIKEASREWAFLKIFGFRDTVLLCLLLTENLKILSLTQKYPCVMGYLDSTLSPFPLYMENNKSCKAIKLSCNFYIKVNLGPFLPPNLLLPGCSYL